MAPDNHTVTLHRVLSAPPARVYRAFTQGNALAKWLPPHGFFCTVHALDVREGGEYRMSFTNLHTGASHAFGGRYLELVPDEKLRYTAVFEDPSLPGEMQTTVTLKRVFCGTELRAEQTGIPAVIPVEGCYLGWQESLSLLTLLVQAEIPG